jgi:hypothetical protein
MSGGLRRRDALGVEGEVVSVIARADVDVSVTRAVVASGVAKESQRHHGGETN